MKSEIRVDRLRILANHLLRGKLGHKKFNLKVLNVENGRTIYGHCGTEGCAAGELPIAFPNEWQFGDTDYKVVSLKTGKSCGDWMDIKEFFKIKQTHLTTLFFSEDYSGGIPQMERLKKNASKTAVAKNMIKFCQLVEKGEIK